MHTSRRQEKYITFIYVVTLKHIHDRIVLHPFHYKGHTNATVELADCKYFTTNLLDLDTIMVRNFSELDSFVVYICTAGKASIRDNKGNEIFVHQGQTVLIPADTEVITISPAPGAKFMETYIGQ